MYVNLSQLFTVLSTQLKHWLLVGKHFTFFLFRASLCTCVSKGADHYTHLLQTLLFIWDL